MKFLQLSGCCWTVFFGVHSVGMVLVSIIIAFELSSGNILGFGMKGSILVSQSLKMNCCWINMAHTSTPHLNEMIEILSILLHTMKKFNVLSVNFSYDVLTHNEHCRRNWFLIFSVGIFEYKLNWISSLFIEIN